MVAALRRLAKPQAEPEKCDFCSVELSPRHRHLLEVANHRVLCVCDPCALRFENVVGGRFKLIPRDARILAGFQLPDAVWETLAIPINLAFFSYNTPRGAITALYPSPGGATESLLPLTSWAELAKTNPPLETLQPDVEALLVNRVGENRDYFIAPIDTCFELVGLIRLHWRGFTGGDEVWREIGSFFDALRTGAVTHA